MHQFLTYSQSKNTEAFGLKWIEYLSYFVLEIDSKIFKFLYSINTFAESLPSYGCQKRI